jgi:dihydrofolate reductase
LGINSCQIQTSARQGQFGRDTTNEIYAQAAAIADEAVVTEIEQDFEGDAFAPKLDAAWHETSRESHKAASGLKFSFVTYQRTA